jgi:aminoglycoside phosphotransferase (APT) family kinase protein
MRGERDEGGAAGAPAPPGELDAIEVMAARTQLPFVQTRRVPAPEGTHAFEVTPPEGEKVVLRFAAAPDDEEFAGARFWAARLGAIGVPVPAPYASGRQRGLPYVIYERPPGTELGTAYPRLRSQMKRGLARTLVRLGRSVRALPAGQGFGFVTDEQGPFPFATWEALVRARLASLGARRAVHAGEADAAALVAVLEAALPALAGHFAQVGPQAFLGGSATHTVRVDDEGVLVAIVGTDRVGYGDPLHTVGRTRAALAARGLDAVLADFWCEELDLAAPARRAVDFYTAVFAADVLADVAAPGGPFEERLRRIVDENLAAI